MSRHAERRAALEPRDVSARGLSHLGAPVHALTAVRLARERGPPPAERALSPFVGRERELETLEELVRAAAAGAGHAVGIVGEPGSGKSRLLFELHQRVRPLGVRYMEQHCLAYGSLTPYGPLLDTLPAHFQIDSRDAWPVVTDKMRRGLQLVDLPPDEPSASWGAVRRSPRSAGRRRRARRSPARGTSSRPCASSACASAPPPRLRGFPDRASDGMNRRRPAPGQATSPSA